MNIKFKKSNLLSQHMLASVLWKVIRAVILLGLCYIILYPFFTKIMNAFNTNELYTQND